MSSASNPRHEDSWKTDATAKCSPRIIAFTLGDDEIEMHWHEHNPTMRDLAVIAASAKNGW
eukprot:CAMPEP_0119554190 /NCGR_PEP_ID=MMETSP1352-20130426/6754_1 /TAXON_ID=265584 /ORGANISM="Stauroneis constricta, Strain CCMP1120" /LENGTH=60 /DNA_ID=CAMNT_0007600741 /DNA_START=140 /DNA_END=319 /DNA_ORIENTATION=-